MPGSILFPYFGDPMIDVHLSQMQGVVGHVPLLRLVVVMEGETTVLRPHWITVDSRPMGMGRERVDVN